MAAAAIASGRQEKLYLGNLDAVRDWGYAKEFVESMWLMLQQENPSDYVVATGIGATVRDFCEVSFERVGLEWEKYVVIDKSYMRPTEVEKLVGDSSKIKETLGWQAETSWRELAALMVDSDIELLNGNS
jgi:GDPmannose 4,6-dehydratase